MSIFRHISFAAVIAIVAAAIFMTASPAETPRAEAAIRGPLVPDSAQCIGTSSGDCRGYIAQPDDGSQILRGVSDGLQLTWLNNSGYSLLPPGSSVTNATLIVRAIEVNTSAGIAVRSSENGSQIATTVGSGTPTAQTHEVSGPALISTVRDAVSQGKDVVFNLNLVPPSGSATAALQIDFVALSIEYQAGSANPQPTSPNPSGGSPTLGSPTATSTSGSGSATATASATATTTATATSTPSGGSTGTTGGSGTGTPGGNGNTPGSGTTVNTNGVWLDLPPTIQTAKFTCPNGGAWNLLYWNGQNETTVSVASVACSTGDRFWVFRNGRWLGYSPLFASASDTWNLLVGEAHFVRGRAF